MMVEGALPCALNPSVVPQHGLSWFLALQTTPSYQYGYGSTLAAATRERGTKNNYIWRKFRSQTSDNMDRWNAEVVRVKEEKRREENRKEERRKKIKKRVSEERRSRCPKRWESREILCFFQWFVALEGRKVGSLKRRVRRPLGRWEMKNCTRREAHFEIKMYRIGPLLEVAMSKKCTPLWREAHFEVKIYKTPHARTTFGRSDVSRCRRKGLWTLSKVSKTWGFCSISKNDGRRKTFEEDLESCFFRGRRSTRDMFIRAVRRPGRWFPERGCILEPPIFRFAAMILRDRCSTSYDLASLFRGRRSTLDRWSGKIAKCIGTRSSALHSTFHFEGCLAGLLRFWCCQLKKLRKSRRIASFLMSSAKIEGVPLNCCVFDVVKFKNWGGQTDRQTEGKKDR